MPLTTRGFSVDNVLVDPPPLELMAKNSKNSGTFSLKNAKMVPDWLFTQLLGR